MTKTCLTFLFSLLFLHAYAQKDSDTEIEGNAPTQYYSLLNNGTEGATAKQTLANLNFFGWMQETYGMRLDSYAIDLGDMHDRNDTLSTEVELIRRQFPENYDAIFSKADELGINLITKKAFVGHSAHSKGTGVGYYINVNANNTKTAQHHRVSSMLSRQGNLHPLLGEDYGICLSSSLDCWDDEFILQAFHTNVGVAPQIYGNPWLLADHEYAKLARIFNLYEDYKSILPKSKRLPESYGEHAIARGDKSQRLLVLSNYSWEPKEIIIKLDEEIGLTKGETVQVRTYHPTEAILGQYAYGQLVSINVEPFRATLVYAGKPIAEDVTIAGVKYLVQKDTKKEKNYEILVHPNGANNSVISTNTDFQKCFVDGKSVRVRSSKSNGFRNKAKRIKESIYSNLGEFHQLYDLPFTDEIYEAAVFAADNNALEVRSIERGGWSGIPEVLRAQDAFFDQTTFIDKGAWDKYLFDRDFSTAFAVDPDIVLVKDACLRIDLGTISNLDQLKIIVENEHDLLPQISGEECWLETSTDLVSWTKQAYTAAITATISVNDPVRYIRIVNAPRRILEVEGYRSGTQVSSKGWRANNLFAHADQKSPKVMWYKSVKFPRIHHKAKLSIALEGIHGLEGAYVAIKIGDKYYGCTDRSAPFPTNPWQYDVKNNDANYTYYFPLNSIMERKRIEIFVIGYDETHHLDFKPNLYLSSLDPYERATIQFIK